MERKHTVGVPALTFILGISLELSLQYMQHHQQHVCARAAHTLAEQGQGSAQQLMSDTELTMYMQSCQAH